MMAREGARIALAVLVVCLLSTICSAQQGVRSASLPDRPPNTPPPPPRDLFLARPGTYVPRPVRPGRFQPYFGAAYGLGYSDQPASAKASARQALKGEWNGYLQLQVSPASALVFVDGLYVGSVDDVRQT